MNGLDCILGGDYYIGTCDVCRQSRTFNTKRERDLWLKYHPHDGDDE